MPLYLLCLLLKVCLLHVTISLISNTMCSFGSPSKKWTCQKTQRMASGMMNGIEQLANKWLSSSLHWNRWSLNSEISGSWKGVFCVYLTGLFLLFFCMICYLPILGTSYWLDQPLVCCSMAILVPFSFTLKVVKTEKNLNLFLYFLFFLK